MSSPNSFMTGRCSTGRCSSVLTECALPSLPSGSQSQKNSIERASVAAQTAQRQIFEEEFKKKMNDFSRDRFAAVLATPSSAPTFVFRRAVSQPPEGTAPTLAQTISSLSSFFIDPGNPEKEKKYRYSLFAIREALNQKFPNWAELLDGLAPSIQGSDQTPFVKHAYSALKALNDEWDNDQNIRKQYGFILTEVRNALDCVGEIDFNTDVLKQLRDMIFNFCHYKFTSVHLYPFFEDWLPKILGSTPNELSLATLPAAVKAANDRLEKRPSSYGQTGLVSALKKLQGTIGLGFDPNGGSNVPWVHSVQIADDGAKCTVLRHGTPTRDPGIVSFVRNDVSNVIPEYKAHLVAHPEEHTLYVNHQLMLKSSFSWLLTSPELTRSREIQNLEDVYNNFHFLSLPLDGPLFVHENLNQLSMEALKGTLVNSLIKGENGFALPAKGVPEDYAKIIEDLFDGVHRLYFKNSASLDADLKKSFIMLFYSELKDDLKSRFKANYAVSVCKDNKDRGNASAIVDMVKNLVKLGLENDPERLLEVLLSILGPFIIKNEAILPDRLMLAVGVMLVLGRLSPEEKEAIRQNPLTGFKIKEQTVPKEKADWAKMMGPKSFIACVENMKHLKEQKKVRDPDFQQDACSSFLKDGKWFLSDLRKQITSDLSRIDIRINGARMKNFASVLDALKLDPELFDKDRLEVELNPLAKRAIRFLAMLQQGSLKPLYLSPWSYFRGNKAAFDVFQSENAVAPPAVSSDLVYPIQIYGTFDLRSGEQNLTAGQELQLCEILGNGDKGRIYPIRAMCSVTGNAPAEITWQLL